ncbi:MAG: DUF554 domain-containing protein [Desulfobulbaceae bacterium]|nr:DUF554 domain-containing protein [Desulfobulbaceae bacterium]
MLGTLVNALAIIAGGLIGLLFRKGIGPRYEESIRMALGLAVALVGAKGAILAESELLVLIFSLVIGTIIGEWLDIEGRLEHFGQWLQQRMSRGQSGGNASFGRAFVSATLLFCVGSMAIVGSLESGLSGNHQTLFAKASLDGLISVVFASAQGPGVLLSAVPVLFYQGSITMAATLLKPLLTAATVANMSAVGGLLIVVIGINLLGITKIRVGNMLPAIFLPLAYQLLRQIAGF